MSDGAVDAAASGSSTTAIRAADLRTLRRGRCVVVGAEPLLGPALRQGLLAPGGLQRWLASGANGPAGRTTTRRVALAGHRELHLRPIEHGGALGPLWRGHVLGVGRAIRELRAGSRLAAAGAPVARPALVAAERRLGFWRAAIAYWHEPDCLDAARFLAADPGHRRALRAAAAAGRALRRFHDAGGRHPDLHAGNLLLREGEGGCEALLVDLDRARAGRPPPPRVRFAEMMRLYRSLAKRRLAARADARACAVFLRAYVGSDRRLRRALLRGLPRERRRMALHRAGWRLLSAARRSSDSA